MIPVSTTRPPPAAGASCSCSRGGHNPLTCEATRNSSRLGHWRADVNTDPSPEYLEERAAIASEARKPPAKVAEIELEDGTRVEWWPSNALGDYLLIEVRKSTAAYVLVLQRAENKLSRDAMGAGHEAFAEHVCYPTGFEGALQGGASHAVKINDRRMVVSLNHDPGEPFVMPGDIFRWMEHDMTYARMRNEQTDHGAPIHLWFDKKRTPLCESPGRQGPGVPLQRDADAGVSCPEPMCEPCMADYMRRTEPS